MFTRSGRENSGRARSLGAREGALLTAAPYGRYVSPIREAARLERIRKVCDGKFPKLTAWKREYDTRTVLLLEDGDIQLTNAEVV